MENKCFCGRTHPTAKAAPLSRGEFGCRKPFSSKSLIKIVDKVDNNCYNYSHA